MSMYKINASGYLVRVGDGAHIPMDRANVDYAAYMAWIDAGNVPETSGPAPRESLKASATARRWQVETGGIVLPNGVRIHTGKDDQDRITSTIAGMAGADIGSVDFKAATGWITLTLDELQAMRSAIARHVQACFSAERAHHEAIDALAETALDGYDLTVGWPQ